MARVKKTGKTFAVVHDVTGQVLSRHRTRRLAERARDATIRRNVPRAKRPKRLR